MKLETNELKFLLRLLGQPGYRGAMGKLALSGGKESASLREKACEKLASKGLVGCRSEVQVFAIAPPGQALLQVDLRQLPISVQDLKILQRCQGRTTPAQLTNVASTNRQAVIRSLEERGLVKVLKSTIREAWLTPEGAAFLREDCLPQGGAMVSLTLVGHYVRFLRQPETLSLAKSGSLAKPGSGAGGVSASSSVGAVEVLRAIAQLDAQHNTENYLPIYLLRQALPMGREALDQALYELQRREQLELDMVREVSAYSPEQLAAGIPQAVGGALFFISLIQ